MENQNAGDVAIAYSTKLVQLHAEMRAGRGESERAQELRSEMAEMWRGLTDEQRRLFDHLSEQLYLLDPSAAGEQKGGPIER